MKTKSRCGDIVCRDPVRERPATRHLESDAGIIAAYRLEGGAEYHACGTCRMGDFPDAVLEPKLRVIGASQLRVVDGSSMPTMVSANTNARSCPPLGAPRT